MATELGDPITENDLLVRHGHAVFYLP